MFSAAPEADFERAAEAGVTLVRFGAVGDAQDFRYLIDGEYYYRRGLDAAGGGYPACRRFWDESYHSAGPRTGSDFFHPTRKLRLPVMVFPGVCRQFC